MALEHRLHCFERMPKPQNNRKWCSPPKVLLSECAEGTICAPAVSRRSCRVKKKIIITRQWYDTTCFLEEWCRTAMDVLERDNYHNTLETKNVLRYKMASQSYAKSALTQAESRECKGVFLPSTVCVVTHARNFLEKQETPVYRWCYELLCNQPSGRTVREIFCLNIPAWSRLQTAP